MVREQAATDQIEAIVGERQRERIGNQNAMAALEMSWHAVEIGNFQLDALFQELLACLSGDFAVSCSNLQQ